MRSHSVQIFSTTGVRVRRSAASSLVIMSACWLLIRSVEDQFSPSRKGGIPVWAISCSRIIRTGAWQSGMAHSAPMTLISTSPTATKSRTAPDRVLSMASAHRWASSWLLAYTRRWSSASSPGLYTTAKRTLPARSQLAPRV